MIATTLKTNQDEKIMQTNIFKTQPKNTPKKARLPSAWLKRAESFKLFLDSHQQNPLNLPDYAKSYQDLMGQMIAETGYAKLRSERYYHWLKTAESLMYLEKESKPLNNGVLRLMISLDYKKFYDALLFEFHYYLSRACFCKLALHYKAKINSRTLRLELEYLISHLNTLFQENRDIYKSEEFIDLFVHAYRSAVMDLCLYHDMNLNILSEPIFYLNGLMHSENNKSEEVKSHPQKPANQPKKTNP